MYTHQQIKQVKTLLPLFLLALLSFLPSLPIFFSLYLPPSLSSSCLPYPFPPPHPLITSILYPAFPRSESLLPYLSTSLQTWCLQPNNAKEARGGSKLCDACWSSSQVWSTLYVCKILLFLYQYMNHVVQLHLYQSYSFLSTGTCMWHDASCFFVLFHFCFGFQYAYMFQY